MKILMVSPEAEPYVRTGGLGDVMGALPAALAKLGHDVRLFLPGYGDIDRKKLKIERSDQSIEINLGAGSELAFIETTNKSPRGVTTYFLGNQRFFYDRIGLYVDAETGKEFPDNDLRFAFFCKAVLKATEVLQFLPDIIHVHDWQAALTPVYLKALGSDFKFFQSTRSILTIHNLGYQGIFEGERFDLLGFPTEMFYAVSGELEYFEKVNFMKGGLMTADILTTVSKRYAQEIQTGKEFGCGLEGVLRERSRDIYGIINGVDYTTWSPSRDKKIPYRYTISNLSGKRASKIDLLGFANLPIRKSTPLLGMVTRLTDQKGVDLLVKAADTFFELDLQLVILGSGEEKYHKALLALQKKYPDKLKVWLEFNDKLAHRIQAGADIFLMPSRYEPCGLNQIYALKYGTVPLVRKVGGLADSVSEFNTENKTGTGFLFEDYTATALLEAVKKTTNLYSKKRIWTKLMKNGMKEDNSWAISAKMYNELYMSLHASIGNVDTSC